MGATRMRKPDGIGRKRHGRKFEVYSRGDRAENEGLRHRRRPARSKELTVNDEAIGPRITRILRINADFFRGLSALIRNIRVIRGPINLPKRRANVLTLTAWLPD